MGIRVTVSASKNGQTIFHKLMYYGPVIGIVDSAGLLQIQDDNCKVLAMVKDWIYYEHVENCEDNRKQYKEGNNEVEAFA